jgi:hypothetical protein
VRVHTPGRGAARVGRGLTLAGCCLLLATVAHVAAGGAAPGLEPALLGGVMLSLVCVAAADRRRSFAGILGVVAVSQPVLHVLLSLSHEATATATVVPDRGMVLAHVVAGLAVAALLAGAEAAVWALAVLSSALLLRIARRLAGGLPAVPPSLSARPGPFPSRRPYGVVLSRAASRRGPPVVAVT